MLILVVVVLTCHNCYLLVVSSSVTHFGTRAFAVAGLKAWNQLSMHIRARARVSLFKTALKTHLQFTPLTESKLSRHAAPLYKNICPVTAR